ncbi:hypothetical protein KGF41_15540 [Clostridioides sp. ZZV14-6150]|uniref:hypothetical protein n=1 Tax=Clostridioides sp. ZZV14-6150 TaxID=2811493 RepID=UPI001D0FD8E0|nr:hypothetical protein [Clostridioides sp. ZZV14-6150]
MLEIVRIVIKGSSGYCCVDEAFKDKVTITSMSITYEYTPYMETQINPRRTWSYKTDSPLFKMIYCKIADIIPGVIEREVTEFSTDIGGIEFDITYFDKSKFKKIYWVLGDYFEDLFKVIKQLIPETEYTPAVLLTSDDYEGKE